MSSTHFATPRIFIIRHGETEWSKSGHYTSFTEKELTATGIAQVSSTAASLIGRGRLIDPDRLAHIFASPRKRTRQTLELLLPSSKAELSHITTFTEEIAEWNYGRYEGLTKKDIRQLKVDEGWQQDREWDVWQDGCADEGESVQQITDRLDNFIKKIKNIQKPFMHGSDPADILLVGHGLALRCLVKRWIGLQIGDPQYMMLDPGAVGVLSYKEHDIDQPAVHIGIQLVS